MSGARSGAGVYREVLSLPGAAAFSSAGVLARLPISMTGIGIVLLVEARYGSYAQAGALAAVYALVTAAASPLLARLVDRRGQARVMRPAAAAHLTGVAALLLLAVSGAPVWALAAPVALMGATIGSAGALVRARWSRVIAEREDGPDAAARRLHAAFSLESVLDEVVFIVGPVLVTLTATALDPVVGLLAAATALGVGAFVLYGQRASEPVPTPGRAPAGSSVLAAPGMAAALVVFLAIGAVFGSVEVVTIALTEASGVPGWAGAVLATYSLSSLASGLLYGTVSWRAGPTRRFVVAVVVFALGALPLLAVPSVGWLFAALFLSGFTISPVLIAGSALVQQAVAASRLTEGLTWVSTALGVGVAAGAAASGSWVERSGAASALAVPVIAAVGAAAIALVVTPRGARPVREA